MRFAKNRNYDPDDTPRSQ